MLTIAVIIPVHDGGQAYERCVESIERLEYTPDELIIVLDGPTASDESITKTLEAKVLMNRTARGPAVARNQGAVEASSDILLFIDADVELPSTIIERVLEAFKMNPDIDAIIGSYDDDPLHPSVVSRYRNLLHHYTHQTSSRTATTFWGACGAIRSSAFYEVDGFSETFKKPSIEDIELGYRLVDKGYHIMLDPTLQVKHLKRWTVASMLRTDVFQRAIPWTELLIGRPNYKKDLNLTWRNQISAFVVFLFLLLSCVGLFLQVNLIPKSVYPVAIGFLGVLFVWLNREFYSLLYRVGGFLFTVASIPWHALFFVYSSTAFCFARIRYRVRSTRKESE